MKKVGLLLLFTFLFLVVYNVFLFAFPLKKTVFYTNRERIEEFVYGKNNYQTLMVGSSLSGTFEGQQLFPETHFNLYLHFTGALTGIEIIKKSNKIPAKLFIEINYVNREINSLLVNAIFNSPVHHLKDDLPFLLTKNKIFPNLTDRIREPSNNKINKRRPAEHLYKELIKKEQARWSVIKDIRLLNERLDYVKQAAASFASKGCQIYFYEMPMDSSLNNSKLINYQRKYFVELALQNGYTFIDADQGRTYQTGDGVHLLLKDANIYNGYFKQAANKKQAGVTE